MIFCSTGPTTGRALPQSALRGAAGASTEAGGTQGGVPEGATEVRQAALAFNRMQDNIRRFVSQRTDMLAGISHDLRTPITLLRLRVERRLSQEGAERNIVDEVRWALERRPELLREGLESTATRYYNQPKIRRRLTG